MALVIDDPVLGARHDRHRDVQISNAVRHPDHTGDRGLMSANTGFVKNTRVNRLAVWLPRNGVYMVKICSTGSSSAARRRPTTPPRERAMML
jgi:hypothetical protein